MGLQQIKSEGLVIAYTDSDGSVYPLACAKDTNITITREMLELAPKSNNAFKRYIPTKRSFTVSGSGLIKLVFQGAQQGLYFFDDMFTNVDTKYVAYLDIINSDNDYKIYRFDCYITELTLTSVVNGFANYSYTLQGTGEFTEITETDTEICGASTSGLIFGRNMSNWKLIGVGYGGKWYFNEIVLLIEGNYYIDIGPAQNGKEITAVYKPI